MSELARFPVSKQSYRMHTNMKKEFNVPEETDVDVVLYDRPSPYRAPGVIHHTPHSNIWSVRINGEGVVNHCEYDEALMNLGKRKVWVGIEFDYA
jgi:hypothetical protein